MINERWMRGMSAVLVLWSCTSGAAELKVWNYHVLDNALRIAEPVDPQPMRIVGCRNGTFSGCVAVESTEPVADLRMNLRAEGGAENPLAGSGVRLRTAVRWPEARGLPPGLDILLESPPEEIPVRDGRALAGAWITVSVPAATPPGLYRAVLELSARDAATVRVPVELVVESWTLPDPAEWRTWIEMIQSPDTLSMEYGLPLWSERHWSMIARSFGLMRGTGTRTVYVPILRETNQGNEESMIRWIREKDGSLRPDFSIMERYLDTAQEHLGDLEQVIFYVWDAYLVTAWRDRRFDERPDQPGQEQQRWDLRQKGLMVTIVNEQTGEVEAGHLPLYTDGSSVEIWRPFYRELRARMRKRGLEDAMLLGMVTDMEPSKDEIEFFQEVTGGLPWAAHSHYRRTADKPAPNTVLHGQGSVGYECHAYSLDYQVHPSKPALQGWRVPELRSYLCRFGLLNGHPLRVRTMPEVNITGNQRGVGRLGADFWSVLRDRRGQRRGQVFERYPHNHWRGLNINNWFLAPGPEGPVGTARLENLREGVQECEALIFLKETLLDDVRRGALDAKTVQETRETLDERQLALWRSYWPDEEHLALLGTISGRSMHEALWSGLNRAGVDLPGFWEGPARSLRDKMGAQGIADFVNSEWQVRNRKLFGLAGGTARATEVAR